MNIVSKLAIVAIAGMLLAPGFSAAHRIGPISEGFKGLPKNYCENPTYFWTDANGDDHYRAIHNYNPAVSGDPTQDYYDTAETGTHDYGPPTSGIISFNGRFAGVEFGDGNRGGDCDGDGIPGDSDRHHEFAQGGAILLARSAQALFADPFGPFQGDGTEICYGRTADHPSANTPGNPTISVYVNDLVWGAAIPFFVAADWNRAGIPSANGAFCGDGVIEPCDPSDPTDIPQVTCNPRDRRVHAPPDFSGTSQENVVTVNFRPGADGSYIVFVGSTNSPGTMGHVGTQPDATKKKPTLPGGIPLPGFLVVTFAQTGPTEPARIVGAGPHCIQGTSGPFSSFPVAGPNKAFVTCAWDFPTSCSGSVVATNFGSPGNVNGKVRCDAGGVIAADATASPFVSPVRDSGARLGTYKVWTCEATFDVVAGAATLGVVNCLVPIRV